MNFRLSIRGAFMLTAAVAVYCAIIGLAFRGNPWGQGITFAVTCSFLVWLFSAAIYWAFEFILKTFGVQEHRIPSNIPDSALTRQQTDPRLLEGGSLNSSSSATTATDTLSVESPNQVEPLSENQAGEPS